MLRMKLLRAVLISAILAAGCSPRRTSAQNPSGALPSSSLTYPIVDTGQLSCYSETDWMPCADAGGALSGQDAQYAGAQPSYTDNGDGTVTDNVTGLMWQKDPGEKMTYAQAVQGVSSFRLAGYDDWRLPTIKELFSLIQFNGLDPMIESESHAGLIPFIDTDYFEFSYGDTSAGERNIDSQFVSTNLYVSREVPQTMFGVNFADGRIKGYGTVMPGRGEKTFFVHHVRGNKNYGVNDFMDNGDGTVADRATGLTWQQEDSGMAMNWAEALSYCETLDLAGHGDWRLPNAKELQSIADYSRSPASSGSPALDPLFRATSFTNEKGQNDWGFYWTSTTHVSQGQGGARAAYIAFGRALGYMRGQWMDVHGAGAQRSDPKAGDPSDHPVGKGPQGDAIRINNYARCVRGGATFTPGPGQKGYTADARNAPGRGGMSGPQEQGHGAPPQGAQPMQPPQEAFNACAGLSLNDSCSFQSPRGAVTGVCSGDFGQDLFCKPEHAPGGPPHR